MSYQKFEISEDEVFVLYKTLESVLKFDHNYDLTLAVQTFCELSDILISNEKIEELIFEFKKKDKHHGA